MGGQAMKQKASAGRPRCVKHVRDGGQSGDSKVCHDTERVD